VFSILITMAVLFGVTVGGFLAHYADAGRRRRSRPVRVPRQRGPFRPLQVDVERPPLPADRESGRRWHGEDHAERLGERYVPAPVEAPVSVPELQARVIALAGELVEANTALAAAKAAARVGDAA